MFFQKNGGYWQNIRGIFAKNGPARRNFGPERPGPARPSWNSGPTGPARPSPLKFARPDLSSLGFTTLLDSSNFKLYSRVKISKLSEMKFLILKKINYELKIFRKIRKKLLKNINQNFRNFSRKLLSTIFVEITFR